MEYYSALKRTKIWTYATTWLNRGYYVEWNKPVTERQIWDDSTYMRYLEELSSERWKENCGTRGLWYRNREYLVPVHEKLCPGMETKNTGKSKQPTKPHKCSGVPRQHRAEGTMKAKMGHLTWNYIIFDLPCLLRVQLAISPCAYPQHPRDVMGYRTRISISTLKRDS